MSKCKIERFILNSSYFYEVITLFKGRHVGRTFNLATFQYECSVTSRVGQSCTFVPEIMFKVDKSMFNINQT